MESDGSSCHYGQPENSSFNSNTGNSSSNVGASSQQQENQTQLPISSVLRIMRQVVPKNAKISDDAKEAVRACVCEYIGFISEEANERCHRQQRRTITSEDLIWAMSSRGFDSYARLLNTYLRRVRHSAASERVEIQDGGVGLPPLPPPRVGGAPPQPFPARGGMFQPMGRRMGRGGSGGGSGSGSGGNEGGTEFDPLAYLNRDRFL